MNYIKNPVPYGFSDKSRQTMYCIISSIMIAYFIFRLYFIFCIVFFEDIYSPTDYNFSELLINFEGGFVRRGLIGQIIFELVERTGWDPFKIIIIGCLPIYIGVGVFLWRKFSEQGLCWWLLLSPLMYGNSRCIFRKDFLCFAVIIGVLCLLRRSDCSPIRIVFATLLSIFGLFVHEAYIFYGVPIAALLVISSGSANWGGGLKVLVCCRY